MRVVQLQRAQLLARAESGAIDAATYTRRMSRLLQMAMGDTMAATKHVGGSLINAARSEAQPSALAAPGALREVVRAVLHFSVGGDDRGGAEAEGGGGGSPFRVSAAEQRHLLAGGSSGPPGPTAAPPLKHTKP